MTGPARPGPPDSRPGPPDRPRLAGRLAEIGDELVKQAGEVLRRLLLRGMTGRRDDLHSAAPQGGNAQLLQVVQVDQLLVFALCDGQRLTQRAGDGDLVGEPAFADARGEG